MTLLVSDCGDIHYVNRGRTPVHVSSRLGSLLDAGVAPGHDGGADLVGREVVDA